MQYRRIERLGSEASVIGFGGEHMLYETDRDVLNTIGYAMDKGINIFDLFWPQASFRDAVARAIRPHRSKMILQGHIGTTMVGDQYARSRDVERSRRYFEDFLRRFDTDYVDIGMMHFVDTMKDYQEAFETEFIEYAAGLKKEGKIRTLGVSSHTAATAIRMIETGLIDVLMFSINPAFDVFPNELTLEDAIDNLAFQKLEQYSAIDPERQRLYRLCAEKGVAITVMKTYAGKLLLFDETSPFQQAMTPSQLMEYALTRPGVVSALVGYKTPREIDAALAYLSASQEERDYTQIARSPKYLLHGKCVYCGHCSPCPQGISIAQVTQYLDMAADHEEVPPTLREHYRALEHRAHECVACGVCEKRCPFKVPVIENMRSAERVFGAE